MPPPPARPLYNTRDEREIHKKKKKIVWEIWEQMDEKESNNNGGGVDPGSNIFNPCVP
jgi:hypothetical protein